MDCPRRRRGRVATVILAAEAGGRGAAGFQINLFWVIVQALNFLLFLVILYLLAFSGSAACSRSATDDRAGPADAEQARRDRESAEAGARRHPRRGAPRGERDPDPCPEGRPGDARRGHRRDPGGARADARARRRRDRGREAARDRRAARRGRRPRARGGRPGRRRDDDRRAPAPARRGVPRRGDSDGDAERTADGPTGHRAARRYAEAAFEIAAARRDARGLADGARRGRGRRSATSERSRVARQPGRARSTSGWRSSTGCSASASQPPVLNLILLLAPARPDRAAAARRRRVPPPRRRAPGHHPRHRHQRRAADRRTRSQALTAASSRSTGGRVDARRRGRSSLLGGLVVRVGDRLIDGSVRGRLERLRNQLVAGSALARRSPQPWPFAPTRSPASSSPRSTTFDADAETRSVGTVVEVGDGIAQIYGLDGALASEMLEFPGGVMGMALNLEEETVGAVILGDASRDQGRRHGQDDRPRRRGAGRPGAARPRRRPARPPARRQGPDRRRRRPARSSGSPPASSSASRSTRRSRPASRRSTR